MSKRVIRISELANSKDRTGRIPVSPATIWRWVKEGKFPKPFKLSDRITVWNTEDVDFFISQRRG
jgi:predicted DNA-binding transcriptional regulator AlpA